MRMVMGFRGVWAYIGDGLEPLGFGMLVGLLRQRVSISYQVKGMLSELHGLAQTARTQGVSTSSENLCAMMACSKLNALPPPVAPNMCIQKILLILQHAMLLEANTRTHARKHAHKHTHEHTRKRTRKHTHTHTDTHTKESEATRPPPSSVRDS